MEWGGSVGVQRGAGRGQAELPVAGLNAEASAVCCSSSTASTRPHRPPQLHVLEVERGMAQGTFRAAIALRQLGCTAEPAAPFNAGARRGRQAGPAGAAVRSRAAWTAARCTAPGFGLLHGRSGGAAAAAAAWPVSSVARSRVPSTAFATSAPPDPASLAVPPSCQAEAERYEQRFGCLDQLFRPELMPYQHFRAATDARAVPPPRVLAAAQASFGGAAQRAGALLAAPQLRALLREELVGVGAGLRAGRGAGLSKLWRLCSVR